MVLSESLKHFNRTFRVLPEDEVQPFTSKTKLEGKKTDKKAIFKNKIKNCLFYQFFLPSILGLKVKG